MRAQALRPLATFYRKQGVFMAKLELDDEIRALALIQRTLRKLPDIAARKRVTEYFAARYEAEGEVPPPAVGAPPVSAEESVKIAREHLVAG